MIPQSPTAVGADLLYASVTKTCGTRVHHRIHGRVAGSGLAGAGSLPARVITLPLISHQLHGSSTALASLISSVLDCALLFTALSLLYRRRILALAHVLSLHPGREGRARRLFSQARCSACWRRWAGDKLDVWRKGNAKSRRHG